MTKKVYELTQEGVDTLKAELVELKEVKRPENLQALKEARAQGDLSENADYDAARTQQAKIEARIKEIENILKNVKIIKATKDNVVNIGKTVTLYFENRKVEKEFTLVGTLEANPAKGKISIDSPIGREIRDHKAGDNVTVKSETGHIFNVEIRKVS